MSRPMYEDKQDRLNETAIIEAWAKSYPPGYQAVKMPMRYMIDFAILSPNRRVVAVAEVKQRSRWYPEMLLSLQKWMELRRWAQMGVGAYWVVRVPHDQILSWYVDWRAAPDIGWIKRDDRDDPEDSEPAVVVPLSAMRPVTVNGMWSQEAA